MKNIEKGDSMKEIGEILKAKRLEKGLTIEEISQQTRMPLPHIKAIEAGNLDYFKNDLSYLRFFLRSYSDAVGADYEQIKYLLGQSIDDYTRAFQVKREDEHVRMEENIQKNKKESKPKNKTIQPVKTNRKNRGKLDFSLVSFLTIVTILVICVLTVSGYYLLRNLNRDDEPSNPLPPVVDTPNDINKPVQKPETPKDDDLDHEDDEEKVLPIRVEKKEVNRYRIEDAKEKVIIKVEFVPSSWFLATMDSVDMKTPASKIYDAGSTVEIEMDPSVNKELKLRFGYFSGMKMYVNDEVVEVDSTIAARQGTQEIFFEMGGNEE